MNREEIEEAKNELKDYIYDKKWIEERLEDIQERRSLLDKITSTLSDMPGGKSQVYDKQAEALAGIIDLTNDLDKYLVKLKNRQVNIENVIDKLAQPYKNILYYRYIKGYNLTETANEIEEEYDYTRKLHGIALIKYVEAKRIARCDKR